jgi:hypothetical protein
MKDTERGRGHQVLTTLYLSGWPRSDLTRQSAGFAKVHPTEAVSVVNRLDPENKPKYTSIISLLSLLPSSMV